MTRKTKTPTHTLREHTYRQGDYTYTEISVREIMPFDLGSEIARYTLSDDSWSRKQQYIRQLAVLQACALSPVYRETFSAYSNKIDLKWIHLRDREGEYGSPRIKLGDSLRRIGENLQLLRAIVGRDAEPESPDTFRARLYATKGAPMVCIEMEGEYVYVTPDDAQRYFEHAERHGVTVAA
ncbi:MAG: hypothetical protein A2Y78_08465 [Acidobacteria bacterium RBG_13_68_16]|nr:MAG: hypothetical protein A2Y78_08465 [Acidobacteria bacterium RBG_13_68_16]